ncbi:helix-turn-helix transcriptional regulator [Streptomyces sp. SID13726]|uniref:helix-turn-helix transcriptional regulator n=1 Tax=Streptomyces sp. SID13726 TaxID=2706058 RepID=UPI0013B82F27|nr:helix-turn-helix transcriptional regulator [Streptomyces sp. SID13726]NEB05797.1 LuxR family transcriptional regulator [Streptomyces sp. SID13726]
MTPPRTTAQTHLRRMADVLAEARQDLTSGVPPTSLLPGLQRLVPCDSASFSELDIPTRRILNAQEMYEEEEDCGMEGYWRWRHQYHQCRQVCRPHDSPETTQMTDFMPVRELRNLPIYTEFLAPHPTIASVALPTAPNRTRVFLFFRTGARSFTEHEMTTLRMLAPHLYDLYKEAARRRRSPVRLTHRELDVLRCVALGMSTAQIAEQLVVSTSTVRKHLENAFGRLGVSSRTAAVARVFPEPESP